MKVWVVMSNDFPDSVFASEEAAEEYCRRKMRVQQGRSQTPRIYYRHYDFEVIGEPK